VPIALVNFVTSYVPFFGALLAGAFAVLIALGANGPSTALAMLAITLLANNTLQNVFEPLAFGRALRLHPLVVMLVTTTGTLLFGLLGAILAAPVTAAALRVVAILREAGLLAQGTAGPGRPQGAGMAPPDVRDDVGQPGPLGG
jgi:predicted PurR-regulated permease PerM